MSSASQEPAYETLVQARQVHITPRGTFAQSLKAGAKISFFLGVAVLLTAAWARRGSTLGPARASVSGVDRQFQVSAFPQDCRNFIRLEGCLKTAWACNNDYDYSLGYKCCCDTAIWQTPQYRPPALQIINGPAQLRLQKTENVCFAGPKEGDTTFTYGPCGKSNTRLRLPPRGAGPIHLDDQAGKCLGVVQGSYTDVTVVPCNQADQQQMFQLTNGDKGMLQWSHGGNKCIDSENGKLEAGSNITLADCSFWPLKPSQVFVLEEAPEPEDDKRKPELPHPSLFCTSIMLPWTYEVDMLRSHLARKVGMFACTGWAVYSNEKVKLKDGATPEEDVYCNVINGSLKAKIGGEFHTALNTMVFRRFWKKVIEDGRVFDYDWTVKLDPDCVFFANRLTDMLINQYQPTHGQTDEAVWLNNCYLGLHGPIEVFSKNAIRIYGESADSACEDVAERHGQEDVYMAHCLTKLGVARRDAFNLLLESEWACTERPAAMETGMPPCYARQVSFHPFKTVKGYFTCYEKAAKMSWNAPFWFNSVPPSKENHHSA